MATKMTNEQREARAKLIARKRAALEKRPMAAFGSLRVLPSGQIQARYVHKGKRFTAQTTFDTLTDADAWLAGIKTDIARGTWVSPDHVAEAAEQGQTVDEAFASYMDEGDLKPRTVDLYRYQWDRLISPVLGNREVLDLTTSQVNAWRATLPTAPRQRQQAVDLLRTVVNAAIDESGKALVNPVRSAATGGRGRKVKGAARVSRDPARTFRLTPEQVTMLADAMPPQRRFAVLFAAGTGVRFGEMAALRRSDIEIERDDAGEMTRARIKITRAVSRARGADGRTATIVGTPKTEAGIRTVALPSRLHAELDAHLDAYAANEDPKVPEDRRGLIFPGASGGFLTSSELYGEKPGVRKHGQGRKHPSKGRGWFRARVEAGVPTARWHLLRHTAISEAVDAGASPATLLARFGHTDTKTSEIYQHATDEADAALADRL